MGNEGKKKHTRMMEGRDFPGRPLFVVDASRVMSKATGFSLWWYRGDDDGGTYVQGDIKMEGTNNDCLNNVEREKPVFWW